MCCNQQMSRRTIIDNALRESHVAPNRFTQRRDVPRSSTSRVLKALAFDLRAPLSGGEGRMIRPRRGAGQEPGTFRRGRSPVEKPGRPSRTGRLYRPATRRGCPSLWLLSDAKLIPVGLGQARESDPASGRRSERPPRRRPDRGSASLTQQPKKKPPHRSGFSRLNPRPPLSPKGRGSRNQVNKQPAGALTSRAAAPCDHRYAPADAACRHRHAS